MSHTCSQTPAERLTCTSLPPCPLRDCVCRPQALRSAQVNSPILSTPRPLPRRTYDTIPGRWPLHRKTRQDTSRMTVNTKVMFRITLYYVPCQAISLPRSQALLRILVVEKTTDYRRHIHSCITRQEGVHFKETSLYIGLRSIVILQQSTLLSFYNLLFSMLIDPQPTLPTC